MSKHDHIDSFKVLLCPDKESTDRLSPVTDRALRASRDLLRRYGANPDAASVRPPRITVVPEGDVIRRWREAEAQPNIEHIVSGMRRLNSRLRKRPIETRILRAYVGAAGGKHVMNKQPHSGGVLPYYVNISFDVEGTPELDALLQDADAAVSAGGLPSTNIARTGEQHLHGIQIDQTPDVLQLGKGVKIPRRDFDDIAKIALTGMADTTIVLTHLEMRDANGHPMF